MSSKDCWVEARFYDEKTGEFNWIPSAIIEPGSRINSELAKFAAMGYSSNYDRATRVVSEQNGILYTFWP